MRAQARDQILPTRILHLPLAFNDKWTHEAISKYMRSSRRDAPYLPSNVDFVAKNNGEPRLSPACETCRKAFHSRKMWIVCTKKPTSSSHELPAHISWPGLSDHTAAQGGAVAAVQRA